MLQSLFVALWLAIASVGVFVAPAHAYLDPGSGSMILQMLVGALVAVAASLKFFWHRIVGFFGRLLPSSSSSKGDPAEDSGKK